MENDNIERMTCEELKERIDNNERPLVIDTRESGQFMAGHIPGAVNVNYMAAGDPMEWEMMLAALPGGRLTVIYCD